MSYIDRQVELRNRAWEEAKAILDVAEAEKRDLSAEEEVKYARINEDLGKRAEVISSLRADEERELRLAQASLVVEGANLTRNEYGSKLFADFFFFITGFHGFHVFSGVIINIIIFFNVLLGTYEKRKSYEMVEKVGLYWHFVDLVWVFVFTVFYLV